MASGGPSREKKRENSARDRSQLLNETNFELIRNFFIVILVATVTWAFCSIVRIGVTIGLEYFLEPAAKDGNSNGIWIVCAVLIFGGVLRGILLSLPSFKGSEGDGVAVAITDFHATYDDTNTNTLPDRYKNPTIIESCKRCLMTILTIGSGGSGGLEAPVLPVGEQVGAFWSKFFYINSRDDLRAFQIAGISAAVATLLDTPFMAAVFATEILFTDRNVYRLMIYSLLSAVVAFILNNHFLNFEPLFLLKQRDFSYSLAEYLQITSVALLASAPAGFGVLWVFTKLKSLIQNLKPIYRPIIGAVGCAVITLIMWFGLDVEPKYILGIGEEGLKELISGTTEGPLSIWWILLLIILAKTIATGLTLMSGGSAGLLVPAMVLGGTSGAMVHGLFVSLGLDGGVDISIYIISGIASALVAVIEVPIAAIAFIMEAFGSNYAPPAIVSVVLCHMVVRKFKQY